VVGWLREGRELFLSPGSRVFLWWKPGAPPEQAPDVAAAVRAEGDKHHSGFIGVYFAPKVSRIHLNLPSPVGYAPNWKVFSI
jgi:hypothetical protein